MLLRSSRLYTWVRTCGWVEAYTRSQAEESQYSIKTSRHGRMLLWLKLLPQVVKDVKTTITMPPLGPFSLLLNNDVCNHYIDEPASSVWLAVFLIWLGNLRHAILDTKGKKWRRSASNRVNTGSQSCPGRQTDSSFSLSIHDYDPHMSCPCRI